MKLTYNFIIPLFIILIFSCQERKKTISSKFENVVKIGKINEEIQFSDIVGDFHYIKLETSSKCILAEIQKIRIFDEIIYVQAKNGLFAFDMKGSYLFTISSFGHGPSEYNGIDYFSIDNGKVNIYDYVQKKIMFFNSKNGKYENYKRLKNRFWQVTLFDGTAIGYIGQMKIPFVPSATRVLKFDIKDQSGITPLINKDDYNFNIEDQFTDYNKNAYWIDPLRNRVFKMNKKEKIDYIFYDFGSRNVTEAEEKLPVNDLVGRNKAFFLQNFSENSQISFATLTIDKGFYNILYNKDTKHYLVYNATKIKGNYCEFAPQPTTVYGNYFCSVIKADEAILVAKLKNKFPKTDPKQIANYKVMESTKYDDNPIIALYNIRSDF